MKTLPPTLRHAALLVVPLLWSGCIGYDSALLATKTNAGLDVDMKPPTLEASLARRELAITPSFENGKTAPLVASFKVHGPWIFASVASTFAGGDAAATMTAQYGTPNAGTNAVVDGDVKLATKPSSKRGWLGRRGNVKLQEPGEVRPLVFGTDTSAGVKVAWSGLTAQYPDTLRAGFHRKELALAPVSIVSSTETTNGQTQMVHHVNVPSFLATTDASVAATNPTNTRLEWVQYFAVGAAADNLAAQPQVRDAMVRRIDPAADTFVKEAAKQAREDGEKLAKELALRIQPLDLAATKEHIARCAKPEVGVLAPAQAKDLITKAETDLPGAKKEWLAFLEGAALSSQRNHAALNRLLGGFR